jgi:cytochrome c oxidase assembly factor CtaG
MKWEWEPSVVIGCVVLAAVYFRWLRGTISQMVCFGSGVLLLLLDLVSPIDTLADGYLFSAHVVQHFLLALIIPMLLVAGIRALALPAPFREARLTPVVAWILGVGTMLAWHLPPLFNAALANNALHIFQHLTFLATGVIFWWPVLKEPRLDPFPAIAYLFSACTACSLLGAILTFTPPGLYPAYLRQEDPDGILRLVREGWGLDPKNDQQLGGMLMWVPGCLVYLSAILGSVVRWYGAARQEA